MTPINHSQVAPRLLVWIGLGEFDPLVLVEGKWEPLLHRRNTNLKHQLASSVPPWMGSLDWFGDLNPCFLRASAGAVFSRGSGGPGAQLQLRPGRGEQAQGLRVAPRRLDGAFGAGAGRLGRRFIGGADVQRIWRLGSMRLAALGSPFLFSAQSLGFAFVWAKMQHTAPPQDGHLLTNEAVAAAAAAGAAQAAGAAGVMGAAGPVPANGRTGTPRATGARSGGGWGCRRHRAEFEASGVRKGLGACVMARTARGSDHFCSFVSRTKRRIRRFIPWHTPSCRLICFQRDLPAKARQTAACGA